MIAAITTRLAASSRARTGLVLSALAATALLALSSGGLAPVAARAGLAAGAFLAAAALARRRSRPKTGAAPLSVLAREPLGRDAGVAVVEADGRRLLVGFGTDGVRLVADLSAERVTGART